MLPALLCCTLVSATTTQCTSFSAFAFYSHFLFSHFFQALLSFCCRVRASATRAKRKGLDNKNYEAYYLSALGFLFPFFPFATFFPVLVCVSSDQKDAKVCQSMSLVFESKLAC